MSENKLTIDHSKQFPTLPHAPIVEAVLHWQASASNAYQRDALLKQLEAGFNDYELTDQHNFEAGFLGNESGAVEFKQRSAWQGMRLTRRQDGKDKFVCQFLRHGVVFSQLAPYRNWEEFSTEAKRFWEKHLELGDPAEVDRLGVRFISQVEIASVSEVGEHIGPPPPPIPDLPFTANRFFHQDSTELSNCPYVINTVRAVEGATSAKSSLIVDIDVLTSERFDPIEFEEKLLDLRFIKNEVFFKIMGNAAQTFGASK